MDTLPNIRLRGDNRIHEGRIIDPDGDKSEGVCGLQGQLAGITGEPSNCQDCSEVGERLRNATEPIGQFRRTT